MASRVPLRLLRRRGDCVSRYDDHAGGLSLKISGGMVGMKADLGGGAACLAAFEAACALGGGELSALHCVLCIAENAIGNDALRCDEIIKFLSLIHI